MPTAQLAVVLFLIAAATAVAFVVLLPGGHSSEPSRPVGAGLGDVTRLLGSRNPAAPLVRSAGSSVDVSLVPGGYRVRGASSEVGVIGTGGSSDAPPWTRFAGGVERTRSFGRETIVVQPGRTEQFYTVTSHQGKRVWTWRLETQRQPVLHRDGRITFAGDRISIAPALVTDAQGRDVTPAGTRWSLRHRADGWQLRLVLDDAALPVPYLIDPAVDYPTTLYFSDKDAASVTGTPTSPAANGGTTGAEALNTTAQQNTWIGGGGNGSARAAAGTEISNTAVVADAFGNRSVTVANCAGVSTLWGSSSGGQSWSTNASGGKCGVTSGTGGIFQNSGQGQIQQAFVTSSTTDQDIAGTTSFSNTPAGVSDAWGYLLRGTSAGTMLRVEFRETVATTGQCAASTICVLLGTSTGTTAAGAYNAGVSIGTPSGGATTGTQVAASVPSAGTGLHTRVQLIGNTLKVKYWTGSTEPDWQVIADVSGVSSVSACTTDCVTGVFGYRSAGGGASNWTTTWSNVNGITTGNGSGFWTLQPGTLNNTTRAASLTGTNSDFGNGNGWIVDPGTNTSMGGTGIPSTTYTIQAVGNDPSSTYAAGDTRLVAQFFTVDVNGSGTVSNATLITPSSAGTNTTLIASGTALESSANVRTATGSNTFSIAATLPALILPAGRSLFVRLYREQKDVINSPTAGDTDWQMLVNQQSAGSVDATNAMKLTRVAAADDTPPTMSSATVGTDGTTVTVTWSEALDPAQAVAGSAFTVTPNGGSAISGTATAVTYLTGNTQTQFTLASAVHHLDSLSLTYTKPGAGATLRDVLANEAVTGSLANAAITNNTANATPNAPTLVTPADAGYSASVTPTLTATFSDPDTNDTGKVSFQICSDAACASPIGLAFDSTVTTLANGANGSAAVPSGRITADGTYYWRAENVDSGAATSSFSSIRSLVVDTAPPTETYSVNVTAGGGAFITGSGSSRTLWYRGGAGHSGTFTLRAAVTDATSGGASITTSSLTGASTGFTYTPGTSTSSPSAGTFDSNAFSYSDPTSSSPTFTAHTSDAAGNSSSDTTFALTSDATPPSSGTLTVNGVQADSYSTSGSFSIATTAFSDGESGLASSKLWRSDGALAGDVCSGYGAPADITGTTTQSGLSTGCYKYEWIGTDNVGNQTDVAREVKVDTTAPSNALTVTENPASADQVVGSGSFATSLYYRPAGAGGSFRVSSSAADGETNVTGVAFPAVGSGITRNTSSPDTSAPYQGDYTWAGTGGASASGAQTVTATNGASNTADAAFSVVPDSAAPTNGVLTVNGQTATQAGTTSTDADGTFDITTLTQYSEAQDATHSGLASSTVTREDVPLVSGTTCDTSGGWANATTITSTSTQTLSTDKCYRYTMTASDVVGNSVSVSTIVKAGVDADGPATSVGTSPAGSTSNNFDLVNDTTNHYRFYYSPAASHSFQLTVHATDGSGVGSVAYSALSAQTGFTEAGTTPRTDTTTGSPTSYDSLSNTYTFGTSNTTAPSDLTITSRDKATAVDPLGNATTDTVQFVRDVTAPATGGVLSVNGGPTATSGLGTTSYFTGNLATGFSISRTDYTETQNATQSGLASSVLVRDERALVANACTGGSGWTNPQTISGSSTQDSVAGISTGNCYRYTLTGTDNAGNSVSIVTTVMVDTTPPSTPAVTFTGLSSGNTYDNGSGTLFFRPSTGGTFTVHAASTDAETSIKTTGTNGNDGYTFSSLTASGGAYASGPTQTAGDLAVTFDASSTGPTVAETVHSTNNASVNSADATFNVVQDSAAPDTGAISVPAYNGTLTVVITKTDYIDRGTNSMPASGLATGANTVTRTQASPTSPGVCPTPDGSYGSAVTISGTSDTVPTDGLCYRYTLSATDNVGNASSVSSTVLVDTTPPSAPSLTLSTTADNGDSFASGSTLYVRTLNGSDGGSFSVDATTSDSQSGIQKVTFPNLSTTNTISGGGDDLSSPYSASYSWTTGSTGGSATVTSTNNATLTSTSSFSVAVDNNPPGGGTLTVNGGNTYNTTGAYSISSGGYGETQSATESGLASSTLTVAQSNLSANTCVAFGSEATVTNMSPSGLLDNTCYRYTLTGTDNVGNTSTLVQTVKVDQTAPTGGSVHYPDTTTTSTSATITFDKGTDSGSDIASWHLKRATCGGSYSDVGSSNPSSPFTDSGLSAGCYQYELVVTDNAGNTHTITSSQQFTVTTSSTPFTVPASSGQTYFRSDGKLFVGGSGTFTIGLTSAASTNVASVSFEDKGTGGTLSGSGGSDSSAPFESNTYTLTGATTDTISVTRTMTDSTTVTDTFHVESDTSGPSGGSVVPGDGSNQTINALSVPVALDDGTDSGAGLDGSEVVKRAAATDFPTCSSFGSFSTTVTLSSGNDTSVSASNCYKYSLTVQDRVGNPTTYTSTNYVKIPDLTAPTFSSAATNAAGTQLTVTFSESLVDTSATTPGNAFTVYYNGVAQTAPSMSSMSGANVVLGLASPPNNSQTVTIAYAQPGSGKLKDLDGNFVASFGASTGTVTNNTPDTVAPSETSATVDGTTMTITFNEALNSAAPNGAAFTVSAGGTTIPVSSASISGSTLTLTLASAVPSGQAVTAAYTAANAGTNHLRDAAGNETADTTTPWSVTNTTAAPPPTTTTTTTTTTTASAPTLTSTTPADGATLASVTSISMSASVDVSWQGMTLTNPDGSTVALGDSSGQTFSASVNATAPGTYTISGSIVANGQTVSVVSHFTISSTTTTCPCPGPVPAPDAPPTQQQTTVGVGGSLTASDNSSTATWDATTFTDSVLVVVDPQPVAPGSGLPPGSRVVSITAHRVSDGAPVTSLGGILEVTFEDTTESDTPYSSPDNASWLPIPLLPSHVLPPGQPDGYFRDGTTIHVLTRHLTYFALAPAAPRGALAMRIASARRIVVTQQHYVAVHVLVTAPAQVTTYWVSPAGTKLTQTTHVTSVAAGDTILKIALPNVLPARGVYRLQVVADDGSGTTVGRTAKIELLRKVPKAPLAPRGYPIAVLLLSPGRLKSLPPYRGYRVSLLPTAALFDTVGNYPGYSAAVVDLKNQRLSLIGDMRSVFPELRIVAIAQTAAQGPAARDIGASFVLRAPVTARQVALAVRALLPN